MRKYLGLMAAVLTWAAASNSEAQTVLDMDHEVPWRISKSDSSPKMLTVWATEVPTLAAICLAKDSRVNPVQIQLQTAAGKDASELHKGHCVAGAVLSIRVKQGARESNGTLHFNRIAEPK